ncbi:MAG: ThuA domain-containing protein [Kiritimatiellia bacterium]
MKKKALIVWGGWDGHEPDKVAELFREMLTAEAFEVEVSDTVEAFADAERLRALHLIIPIITMSKIENKLVENVSGAVANGTGLAGCHGGMCDAFRENVLWAFMTGGTWVSHPGGDGTEYIVNIRNSSSPLVEGMGDFTVKSEQYYLHIDPVVEVLATTSFPLARWYHSASGHVDMPVAWTKRWGVGRVYYNSLGHHKDVIDSGLPREMLRRGFLWAAEGKTLAAERGQDASKYASVDKQF